MPKRVPMGRALTIAVCASYFCRNSLAWRPVFSSGGGRHSEGSRVRIHRHHHRVARTSPSHVVQHRGGPTSSSRLSMSSEEQEALDLNEAPAGLNNPRPEVASEGLIVEDAEQRQQQQQQPWCEEELKTQGMPTLTASTQWRMFLSLKVTKAMPYTCTKRSRAAEFPMYSTTDGGILWKFLCWIIALYDAAFLS